jgi:hypothetical protein
VDEARASQGLQAWAGFPADRQPRPLVLLSPAVRPAVFSDGQKKIAFLQGAVEAAPDFPASLLEALHSQPRDYAGPPVLLTTATLGETEFATDRGRRRLPAWEIWAEGVREPFWVLDPATGQLTWEPPGRDRTSWRGRAAALGLDGQTLTMTGYRGARILESGNAVAILPVSKEIGPGSGWQTAHGERRELTVVLARPLGNRVLLDETGSPVMVTPAPSRAPRTQ